MIRGKIKLSEKIEIEFKSMLTKIEYTKLLHYYQITDDQFTTQTNLYFDTTDFQLKKLGMGLRIRQFAETAEATLKIPQQVGLLEVTDNLSLAESEHAKVQKRFSKAAKEIQERLRTFEIGPSDLHLIGNLITKRAEFTISEGKLALDESWYSDQHDYELELEVPDSSFAESEFKELLNKFHVPYRKTQNKIARAVTAQLKQNKEMEGKH